MFIKRKIRILSSLISIGLFSIIFGLFSQGVAHAATGTYYKWTGASSGTAGLGGCSLNCWSVYGNWDISTNGGVTYNAATSGEVPNNTDNGGAGDNIVFDNTSLGSATTVNDDISGLIVDSLTSQGTGTYPDYFTISGDSFSLVNGENGTPNSVPELTINNNITFSASQTYGATGVSYDEYILDGTLTIPSNVTLTAASPIYINVVDGAGSLILQGPGSGPYDNYHSILNAGTISGSIEIQSGATLGISTVSTIGTASLTIDNGGQLLISDSKAANSDTITLPNNITMAGNGAGASQQAQGAIEAGLYDTNDSLEEGTLTVNLSGDVTLTGDTTLSSSYSTATTFNVTGTLNTNGYNFTAVTASQPVYGTTTVEVNGQPFDAAGSATGSSSTAPNTPDTGSGLTKSNVAIPLIGATTMAGGIYFISRRLKKTSVIKR